MYLCRCIVFVWMERSEADVFLGVDRRDRHIDIDVVNLGGGILHQDVAVSFLYAAQRSTLALL
jgi:hypothetical protein